jgi:hypothetical protein
LGFGSAFVFSALLLATGGKVEAVPSSSGTSSVKVSPKVKDGR